MNPERVAEAAEVPEAAGTTESPATAGGPEVAELPGATDVSEEVAEMPVAAQDAPPAAKLEPAAEFEPAVEPEIEREVPATIPNFIDISITHEDVGNPDAPTIMGGPLPPIPSMDDPPEEMPARATDNLPWPAIAQDDESEEIGLDAVSTTDEFPSLEEAPSEEPNDEQT